jgi:hypothetical protein
MTRTRWPMDEYDEHDDYADAADHRCPTCETPLPVSALIGRRRAPRCAECRREDGGDD